MIDPAESFTNRRDGVRVWLIDWSAADDVSIDRCTAVLNADEIATAGRFRVAAARQQYVIAHAALRLTLSAATPATAARDWVFGRGLFGKPHVAGEGPFFNLSHADGLAAVAVSSVGEVGIDVESFDRPIDIASMSAVLSDAELRELKTLDPVPQRRRFFELWTAKEAYAKATGRGLSADVKSVRIQTKRVSDDILQGTVEDWLLHQFIAGQHWVAVASHSSTPRRIRRLNLRDLTAGPETMNDLA